MDAFLLQSLGLTPRGSGDTLEVELELGSSLINPLNHRILTHVTLRPVGDRLELRAPLELTGLSPVSLQGVTTAPELEAAIGSVFDSYVLLVQRRSDELQALGISPQVNPDSLVISATVQVDNFTFLLTADKVGTFRVAEVTQGDKPLRTGFGQVFELSEFRERDALVGYLLALVNALAPVGAPAGEPVKPVLFEQLLAVFGTGARLPARSGLEVLVTVLVAGSHYRFAAARVSGRTFRGLLAGPHGKVWAERFELEEFPGVVALVAKSLGVTVGSVEVLGPDAE